MLYLAFWGTAKMFCAAFFISLQNETGLSIWHQTCRKKLKLGKDLNLNPKTIKLLEKR